jgi:hypothetical protein
MPRPATNRAVAEEIARAYEKFDRQELINILAYLTKTYVVDGTMPFNLVGDKAGPVGDATGAEKDLDFVKLVDQLKRRCTHIPELGYFQVEEGKVTLRVANQKITFGERVTSEFVTSSAPPPSPAHTAKGAAGAIAAASKAAQAKQPAKEDKNLSDTQQEALNDIMTRFKNLELD